MALKGKKTAGRPVMPSTADSDADDGWWARNWHTFVVLMAVVLLAFLMRVVFVYGISTDGGFFMSGGPDAAYHQRIIEYIVGTGTHLVIDPLLNYPNGLVNPNPPLMDWSVALSGMFLSLFGIPVNDAALWVLVMHTAVLGALSCIPVYLIAREAFGRRAGMVAAVLFAVSAGAIGGSVMSNGDHDAFVMFFILWALYFLLRALEKLKDGPFVESYRSLDKVRSGFRECYRANRLALAYAVMGGICLAAVELTWKGFTYVTVIIIAYLFVQLLLDRFTGRDSLPVTLVVSTMLFTGIVVGAPYYIGMGLWQGWYDIPTLMAFGALFVGLGFSATRSKPWTLVLPAFVLAAAVAMLMMWLIVPDMLASLLSGQGYFGYNKLYSTIAEAQAPSFSKLATEFGWLTIWLSFLGVAYMIYRLPKNRSPARIMITVWLAVAIYMASSANRFIFNGAPAFAIAASLLIIVILERVDLVEYMQEIRAAGLRGMWRKMLKPVPFLTVMAAVFMIMVPNVLFAVDASMPYNSKAQYDREIYDTVPSFLRPSEYSAYQYLGTSGFSINTPDSYYWYDAWQWLSQQDTHLDPADRPAFLSWWDYGHEAVAFGQHPTVADNFQNGYQLAGSFLTAQSEAQSIALLIARSMENSDAMLKGGVRDVLTAHGLNADTVEDMLFNGQAYISEILANPSVYGPYTDDLDAGNARYIALSHYLTTELTQMQLVDLYSALRPVTGADIGYVAIDYRMFPLYYGDRNIMAAFTLLSDFALDQWGVPSDFYELYAVLSTGSVVPLSQVSSTDTISDIQIVYNEMMYSSMLWRLYAGYSPSDLGLTQQGIGGVSGSLSDYQYMPAWNLSNYRAVYSTAFYNPYTDYANHSDAWQYISYDEGLDLYQRIQAGEMTGVVDLSPISMMRNGVLMLQYYDGVIINGTVSTESGTPASGVRVTVFDEYGTPHMSVLTDDDGYYEILAPFGNVTVAYTYGELNALYLVGESTLAVQEYTFTYEQAMRVSDYQVSKNLTVSASQISGSVYLDMDIDQPLEGAEVNIEGNGVNVTLYTNASGQFSHEGLMPGDYNVTVTYDGHVLHQSQKTLGLNDSASVTVAVSPASISGVLRDSNGQTVSNQDLRLLDLSNGNSSIATTNNTGTFSFSHLLPGVYELETVDVNITVGRQQVTLSNGQAADLDLQMLQASVVNGTVSYGGVNISNALLLFQSPSYNVSVSTGADGSYELALPAGTYSVYVRGMHSGSELVNLTLVNLSSSRSLNISLVAAQVMSGHVTQGGAAAATDISVRSANGAVLQTVSSSTGYYRLALPMGSYQLLVQGSDGAYWSDLTVVNGTQDIALTSAYRISGVLWYDADGDGVAGDDEGLSQQTVRVSSNGKIHDTVTDADGYYSVMLPAGSSYSLSSSVSGFQALVVDLTNLNADVYRDLQAIPVNRTVTGNVELNGSAAAGVTVQFIAENGSGGLNTSAVTDVNGNYEVALRPGSYDVMVWHNVTLNGSVALSGEASLSAYVNQAPQALDLDLVKMILTTVTTDNVDNLVMISGQQTLSGSLSYQLYLAEGNHSVYAMNEAAVKAYLSLHSINESSSVINAVPVTAYQLSGNLYYNDTVKNVPLQVSANLSGALRTVSASGASYNMLLPAGSYTITGEYSGLDDGMYYRYNATESVTLGPSAIRDLNLSRSYANSSVDITVLGYDPDDNVTTVQFLANDQTAMDASFAVIDNLSVQLAPGEYTVYASNGINRSYLGTLSVALGADSEAVLDLEESFYLSGRTLASSVAVSASIVLQQGESSYRLQSDANGLFAVLLPQGYYDLSISTSVVENGMTVQYSGDYGRSLRQTVSNDYNMDRQDQRSVSLDVNGPTNVTPGQSYTYTLNVANVGNTVETITLASNGWNMTFTANELSMGFGSGASSQQLQFTLQVPSNALVAHDAVKVLALGADGVEIGSATLALNVSASQGVTLALAQAQATDGGYYSYAVYVNNTGNAATTFELGVNISSLATSGWQASLRDASGNVISQVTVSGFSSQTVYVRLTPQSESPAQPTVTLQAAYGSEEESLTFLAPLPQASVGGDGVSVDGPNVHSDSGEVPMLTWFLLGASILAIMLFLMMGISRGVFSRRKR